jgi:hypothetical protein
MYETREGPARPARPARQMPRQLASPNEFPQPLSLYHPEIDEGTIIY